MYTMCFPCGYYTSVYVKLVLNRLGSWYMYNTHLLDKSSRYHLTIDLKLDTPGWADTPILLRPGSDLEREEGGEQRKAYTSALKSPRFAFMFYMA